MIWSRVDFGSSPWVNGARAEEAGELRFEIVDDGVGCDVEAARSTGAGLTNMSERVAAVGGTLTVDSATGRGTHVRGRIPLVPRG